MMQLQAQNLSKSYTVPTGPPLEILFGVSLSLQAGESAAILGPSGSGKSTLLAILGTLDRPTSGSLKLANVEPFQLSEPELATFRSRHIGFVFQDHHLLPQCTVLENVLLPLLADGKPTQENTARATQLIEQVGLSERQHHRPSQLSGGQKQRAAIARAMVRQPTLLLADEPTGDLDQTTADTIGKVLIEMQQAEQTILVVVTHSMSLASQLQRRYELDQGILIDV
ncbi:MAG: ABC transporter ATP-binding protein [Pirellulales bacterium]